MTQNELFHQDFMDALSHCVKAMGGCEAVAADLWPKKPRATAGRWLADCLNPNRDAKIHLDDLVGLLALARERGIHAGMHFLTEAAGYMRPELAAPKTPAQQLAEQMKRCSDEFQRLADEHAALTREQPVESKRAYR